MFLKKSNKIMFLDITEAMIIWSLRKVSGCSLYCVTIETEFQKTFGENYDDAIDSFREFAKNLAQGKRDLKVGTIDNPCLSRDEASILEMFYAAADDDDYLINAHASWILGKNDCHCALGESCKKFTHIMLENNLIFSKKTFETINEAPQIPPKPKGKFSLRLI